MQFTTTIALLLSLTSATLAAESNKMARTADLAALEAADVLPRDVPGITRYEGHVPNIFERWVSPQKRQMPCCKADNQNICVCRANVCAFGNCGPVVVQPPGSPGPGKRSNRAGAKKRDSLKQKWNGSI
ncbi:hypothetical protein HYFRA_00007907 [Hymenoscyphus fraxineus]|uniref:Uncharacterized protein n=1 Tax=Hymenoscyphus fraxineus TaxID=746836 RepID=A0A9N9KPV0_9HELO|nr:hypothetical protein HYFRA_00007907 [Hymenoscyphus fraxineus]